MALVHQLGDDNWKLVGVACGRVALVGDGCVCRFYLMFV